MGKLWIIYPPDLTPAAIPPCVAGPLRHESLRSACRWAETQLDALTWFAYVAQEQEPMSSSREDHERPKSTKGVPYIFLQRAGEVVYLPGGWHHATINLSGSGGGLRRDASHGRSERSSSRGRSRSGSFDGTGDGGSDIGSGGAFKNA